MSLDLDTFLTAVYTAVDDLYQTHLRPLLPPRPGPAPRCSDSELLTLAVLAEWYPFPSHRAFHRWAQAHLRPYFPHLPSHTRFHRRVHLLNQALGLLFHAAARQTALPSAYRVIDATPLPVSRLPRTRRSPFHGYARLGKCAAKRQWYFGFKLLLAVDPDGVVTSAALLPPNRGDRPGAEAIFEQEQHPIYLADKGFCSVDWEQFWWEHYGVRVLAAPYARHRRAWSPAYARQMSGRRQVVETVINSLKDTFGLERHRTKSLTGLLARTSAKLAAYVLGQAINLQYGRPRRALASLCTW